MLLPASGWTGACRATAGRPVNARFDGLDDVAVGRDGSIYLADGGNHRIRKIDPQGIIDTLAISVAGGSDAGRYITGVAVADDNTVYFSQQDPDGVFRVKDGKVIQIAGAGDAGIRSVRGLDVGLDGSVYVADTDYETVSGRILKISPKGEFSTIDAGLSVPYDVNVDYQGDLYVVDNWNYDVKKITPAGEVSVIVPRFEDPVSISVSRKDCGIVVVSDFEEVIFRYD
jgi:serine/threonine-protein kinase